LGVGSAAVGFVATVRALTTADGACGGGAVTGAENTGAAAAAFFCVAEVDAAGAKLAAPNPTTFGAALESASTEGAIRTAAPTLGQHTREILSALGCDAARLDALAARGVIST